MCNSLHCCSCILLKFHIGYRAHLDVNFFDWIENINKGKQSHTQAVEIKESGEIIGKKRF